MANIENYPNATGVQLFLANNTRSYLQSNLQNNKIALESDTGLLAYKDSDGNYHTLINIDTGLRIENGALYFNGVDVAGSWKISATGATLKIEYMATNTYVEQFKLEAQ